MATTVMKIATALLLSAACISANPVPIPNPLFHEPKPVYPDISPVYPVPNSIFSERGGGGYPYGESDLYVPEALLASLDAPLEGGYMQDDFASGADLAAAERLALSGADRGELLNLLTSGLAPAEEGDDYSAMGYDMSPPLDADWYEALGLVSPYDNEDTKDEYEDYLSQMESWPRADMPQLPTGPSKDMDKKAGDAETSAEHPAVAPVSAAAAADANADENDDDEDDGEEDGSDGNDGDDESANAAATVAAENLVQQIEELRKSIRDRSASQSASQSQSASSQSSHPAPATSSPSTSRSEASAPPASGEAPLVDQLREAAAEASPAPPAAQADSETPYETIKRFLVIEDALKRLPKKANAKKSKRFVSDKFSKQLEDLRTVKA